MVTIAGQGFPEGYETVSSVNEGQTFRERQAALKDGYREDPASAVQVSVARSVTEPGPDPSRIKVAIDGPSGAVIEMGAHPSVGGAPDLPCSGDILMASLAGCYELTLRLVASAMGITIHRLDLQVIGEWDARGTLAVDREAPIGYTSIRIVVDVACDAQPDQVERLLKSAKRYCVVGTTLERPPVVEVEASVSS
jgi:uncharacterized OsmC-like protein